MQFSRRLVVGALCAILFAGWLFAEGIERTDLPNTLKEIQQDVRHLSEEVKSLQAALKEFASATKHGNGNVPMSSVPPQNRESDSERAREAYDRASRSEKLKLYQAAAEAYTESIALDPKNEAAFLHRGVCFLELNELENALADLNQSLRLQPNNSRAYGTRASVEARIGQGDKALADLNQALERDPTYSEAHILRGELFLRNGDAGKAIADFTSALKPPTWEKAYLRRSEAYRSTGQLDLALADCNQALRINPESASGFLCRAECYLKKGSADLAIADLSRAASSEDSPSVKTMVSNARGMLSEQTERRAPEPPPAVKPSAVAAAPAVTTTVAPATTTSIPPKEAPAPLPPPAIAGPSGPPKQAPAPPAPLTIAGRSGTNPARPAQVVSGVSPAASANSPSKENSEDYDRQGRQAIASGDLQEALAALTRAIAIDPKSASAHNARGYVYLRLRQPQQALADFSESIRLNAAYLNAYHNRAVARRLLGDSNGAREDDQSYDRIARTLRRPAVASPVPQGSTALKN